jgi:hypothetical protein
LIKTGDKVRVEKIIDQFKGDHLKGLIGRKGVVISYIIYKNIKRHKVQFQDGLEYFTGYFRDDELVKIEDGE